MRAPVTFAHALADETRWRIIHLVFAQALCVCELADVLGLPQSTLSSQLKVIQKAGLLASERQGKWMFYRVDPAFHPLLKSLFKHFGSSSLTDATLARDARKARNRLAQRDEGCCPPKTSSRAATARR
ncbi:MAG: transcriptional regulator, ArsR family [Verrucomicrobiaceae bacterium]|nr:transcriptional regulator, ArsR family [Verrucomicrobiaceae bacterium]